MIAQSYRRGINAKRPAASTTPTFIIAVRNRATGATSNTVGTLTGVQTGDILVAFCTGAQTANNVTVTPPAALGWSEIADTGAGLARTHVYVTTATSTNQSGGTWSWSGGTDTHNVVILAYRNVIAPVTASTTATTTTVSTIDAPTRTTVANGAIMLTWAAFVTNGSTTPTWSGLMTSRAAPSSSTAAGSAAEEVRATAGATGTRTFNTTNASPSSGMTAATVILEPA